MRRPGQRRRPVRQLQLPRRDRRHRARRVPRGERVRLDDRRDRAPRGRRQHDAAQAAGHDQVRRTSRSSGASPTTASSTNWHRDAVNGDGRRARAARSSCSTAQGNEKARWNFFDAWPTKWTGPTLQRRGQRRRDRDARARARGAAWSGREAMFQTEYDFTLPLRLPRRRRHAAPRRRHAARDRGGRDPAAARTPRVQQNPAYLIVILLSRVVTRLGSARARHAEDDRGAVRRRPRVPAGPLQRDQPAGRRRRFPSSARNASTTFEVARIAVGGS